MDIIYISHFSTIIRVSLRSKFAVYHCIIFSFLNIYLIICSYYQLQHYCFQKCYFCPEIDLNLNFHFVRSFFSFFIFNYLILLFCQNFYWKKSFFWKFEKELDFKEVNITFVRLLYRTVRYQEYGTVRKRLRWLWMVRKLVPGVVT